MTSRQTLCPQQISIGIVISHFPIHVDCYGVTKLVTTKDCKRPLNCADIITKLYTVLFDVYLCEVTQCYDKFVVTCFGFTV